MTHTGLIINSYGYQYIVAIGEQYYQAVSKSKKTEYVVGDLVEVNILNEEQVQIISLHERKNLVYRMDQNRSKIIASNIDCLFIVIAAKPNFNINFLNSCLIFAESASIPAVIIINKVDLNETQDLINQVEALYCNKLHYSLLKISALTDCSELLAHLNNKRTLLLGQSGVGKSTLINQLIPQAMTRTGIISKSEASGCHTTTNATLYSPNSTTSIIDCPGLQEFGLYHLELKNLVYYFPELHPYINKCKYRNCNHTNETQCAIKDAFANGNIDPTRYNLFQMLTSKLASKSKY
jgi:ribosome biogenesis GTPase